MYIYKNIYRRLTAAFTMSRNNASIRIISSIRVRMHARTYVLYIHTWIAPSIGIAMRRKKPIKHCLSFAYSAKKYGGMPAE